MTATGFSRPSLQQLREVAEAEINANVEGADARLRRNVLGVLASVIAGQTHGLYGYLDFIARQTIVDTADAEYLERWGTVWGVSRKPASKAAGLVTFSGAIGATIGTGVRVQSGDGVAYVTTASGTFTGSTITLAVEAEASGASGNAQAGVQLSLTSPVAAVQSSAVFATGGATGGADVEGDDGLRERILTRIQAPPHGGAGLDYEGWALEVAGVTRAWVYPTEMGAGTVTVRFVMDTTYANGIPEAGDVAAVQAHIDAARPVTAEVFVVAPTAQALDVTVAGLSPDTPEVRAAIEAELADMLVRNAYPGATIRRSWLWEAVSIASGESHHEVTDPAADVTHATGVLPVLGTVSYTA